MLYLILFYWIFAALFFFGVVYEAAKEDGKSMLSVFIVSVFIGCLLIGGILFPIYLGRNLNS